MKTVKRLVCLLLSVVFMFSLQLPTQAYERSTHDEQLKEALFRKTFFSHMYVYTRYNETESNRAIKALQCAAYLAIDQFNGSGKSSLETLMKYGVKDLPDSIFDIDYSASSQTHREPTHRGWNVNLEQWKERRQIHLNTTEKMFDSKLSETKKDSFSAIVYYVHLLGDRETGTRYYPNSIIIELGGHRGGDDPDIITELIKHIEILFSNSHMRNRLVGKLHQYHEKVSKLLKDDNGADRIPEGDIFEQYKQYAQKTRELLADYLPEMLKNEQWFSDVFYSA